MSKDVNLNEFHKKQKMAHYFCINHSSLYHMDLENADCPNTNETKGYFPVTSKKTKQRQASKSYTITMMAS